MPLLEFACRTCGHHFEELVGRGESTACPRCKGEQLERQLSTFGVSQARPEPSPPSGCGACGDPQGPGPCSLN